MVSRKRPDPQFHYCGLVGSKETPWVEHDIGEEFALDRLNLGQPLNVSIISRRELLVDLQAQVVQQQLHFEMAPRGIATSARPYPDRPGRRQIRLVSGGLRRRLMSWTCVDGLRSGRDAMEI